MPNIKSPLGHFLRERRIAAGFDRPGILARLLRPDRPLDSVSRLGSRIRKFEEECVGNRTLFNEIVQALGITPQELAPVFEAEDASREAQETARRQEWEAWAGQPVTPSLVTKAIPGIYFSKVAPADIVTLEEAEAWVKGIMTEEGFRNPYPRRLVYSRRLSVWFDRDGNVTARAPSTSGDPGHPYMRIGNKRFLFSVESGPYAPPTVP